MIMKHEMADGRADWNVPALPQGRKLLRFASGLDPLRYRLGYVPICLFPLYNTYASLALL